jgi:hypothetical protein
MLGKNEDIMNAVSLHPKDDRKLSSVQMFWYLLWFSLAEVMYLIPMVINDFMVGGWKERLHIKFYPYHIITSCCMLVAIMVTLVSKRNNYVARYFLLVVDIIALFVGLVSKCSIFCISFSFNYL